MTKITLSDVGSLIDATTAKNTINANSAIIETASDNNLSRDGTSPNAMESNFDMNSFQILNLPNPATPNSPLRLQDLSSFIGGGTIANIPTGGTAHQVLAKTTNADYAMEWDNSVTSVGLALPADFTVTNSPVTTTGSLTGSWATPPTGTGAVVRATSPTLVTPALGTPTSGVATNLTGTASGLTAGNVTTNANLTGVITSVGNATSIASQTGTGSKFVVDTSPTLVTPTIGVATATSVNKVAITAPATSATLTIANGATLTAPSTATVSNTNTGDQTITLTSDVTGTGTGSFATTIANNVITNAKAAQMAANTLKGNVTGSTANAADFTITGLTNKASPAATDELMIWDVTGTAIKKATVSSIASAGSVSSIAGNTGAFTLTKGITNTVNAIGLSLTNSTLQASPANPAAGASASTTVMMGLGSTLTITPSYSGRIKFEINFAYTNSVINSPSFQLKFGTGAAPANGAAATGTSLGNLRQLTATSAGVVQTGVVSGIATGLTPGTAYWFDLMITGASTGTCTVSTIDGNAFEF